MGKICKKCNFNNDDNVKICSSCGCDLTEEPQSQTYDYMRKANEDVYDFSKRFNSGFLKIAGVIFFIISIVCSFVFYEDIGYAVLLIPLVCIVALAIIYLRERLRMEVTYHSRNAVINTFDRRAIFCPKCGNEINSNATSCDKCGNLIEKSNNIKSLSFLPYGILGLGIFICRCTDNVVIQFVSVALSYIIGLITIIVLKIKYPNEKSINVSLIIYCVITLLLIGAAFVLIEFCNSCQGITG